MKSNMSLAAAEETVKPAVANKHPDPQQAIFGAVDIRLMPGYKPPVARNEHPNPRQAVFGAVDIRLKPGYKPPVARNEHPNPPQATGFLKTRRNRGLNPTIAQKEHPNTLEATVFVKTRRYKGMSPAVAPNEHPNTPQTTTTYDATNMGLSDGDEPPVAQNKAPPPSAEDFCRLIHKQSRAEVEKWNFCRRVHEGEIKYRKLERGRAFTEKLLLDALKRHEEKDLAIAKLQHQLHDQEQAARLNQETYSELLEKFQALFRRQEQKEARHKVEIEQLLINAKVKEEEWATQVRHLQETEARQKVEEEQLKINANVSDDQWATQVRDLQQTLESLKEEIEHLKINSKVRDEEWATQVQHLKETKASQKAEEEQLKIKAKVKEEEWAAQVRDLQQIVESQKAEIEDLKINANVRDEEWATQANQIQTLTMNKKDLEDICLSMKKKSLGVFGRKMADRNTEVDKMVKKMKAKEEPTGFFRRPRRTSTRDGDGSSMDPSNL